MTALATATTPTSLADNPGHWTRGHAVEVKLCRRDFLRWCERWAKIEDKETHRAIPFAPYRCQEKLGKWLVGRQWLRILKARRLGVTWMLAAFAVWLVTLHQMQTVGYVVHKATFAYDFLKRCRFIYKRLPWFLRSEITQDTKEILEFDQAGQGCWIRAFAATPGAADSVAADMVIVDEATKIEKLNPGLLRDILRSAEPTVETSNGSVILCGTSEGPQGEFYRGWQAEQDGKGRYRNVFWSWQERPGRNRKWYEQTAAKHKSDPLFMPRQYPNSAEEAFAHAEGRIYPRFAENTHVCRFDRQDRLVWAADQWEALGDVPVNSAWTKWRSIDWGGRDPFCCYWICKIPGNRSALTIDPSCRNLIREMMAYRRKPDSEYIEDKDNHGPDCLRYAVVTFNLHGHIYVYRELYEPDHAAKGLALPALAEKIHELTGDEEIRATVADRSRTDNILLMKQQLEALAKTKVKVPLIPHTKPSAAPDKTRHEVEQGIDRVNILIVGTHDMFPVRPRDPVEVAWEEMQSDPCPSGVGTTMQHHRRTKQVTARVRHRIAQLRGPSRRRRRRLH